MTTPSISYDWIREIKPELKALDTIPLTGTGPSFPWEQLASRLAKSFDRQNISIKSGETEWLTKDQLYEGLGDSPFPLIFAIPSLRGSVCWVMPEQDMVILESLLLTKETHPISFQDRALSESFYRFLALEVLYNLSQIEFDKTVTPILTNQTTLPNENSLCLDISLTLQQQVLWGRLIISPDLRQSWVEHFARKGNVSTLTKEIAQKVDVIVHLEAGKTQLSMKEWSQIALGDFISLDSCSLEAEDLSGRLMLTVHGRNIFRAKLKDGNVKILEFPLYHEVETPMAKQHEDEDEDDFSDFDELSETEDEDEDDLDVNESTFVDTEDEDLFDEDDLDLEEESTATVTTPSREVQPKEKVLATETKLAEKGSHLSLEQIPVSLVVEVGRIQINIQKLLELEPGNLLELDIHPEDGVDLVINGKKVGKGELIRIGEVLGVRVLNLGN
jgi:flagellar motor switch protein FliN/FliY